MGGRILALNEGPGYRPVLVVQGIDRVPQYNARRASVVLRGDQVLFPLNGLVGTSTPVNFQYQQWFTSMIGVPRVWSQMRSRPPETLDQFIREWPRLPFFSVKEATLVLRAAGNDPTHGYWLQFDGERIPLFDQQRWWEEDDNDYYEYENLHHL